MTNREVTVYVARDDDQLGRAQELLDAVGIRTVVGVEGVPEEPAGTCFLQTVLRVDAPDAERARAVLGRSVRPGDPGNL